MMNFILVVVLVTLLFTTFGQDANALVPSPPLTRIWGRQQVFRDKQSFVARSLSVDSENDDVALVGAAAADDDDCGCSTTTTTTTIYSGKLPNKARTMDLRRVIGTQSIYTVNGDATTMNELIGTSGTAVVVFLRSLG